MCFIEDEQFHVSVVYKARVLFKVVTAIAKKTRSIKLFV